MKTLITTLLLTSSIYAADITLSWNDKTFPTSGTNYAEDLTASFNGGFTATRYISFGGYNKVVTRYYDDLEVTYIA